MSRGVVHVAAEEFVLCAVDDSLPDRSSADDVSSGRECVSMQLAGVSDGVLDGKGIFSRRGRGRREEAVGIVWTRSDLFVREGGLSQPLYRRFCGGAEGEVLGVPGAGMRV
jgi:hypothetical protein